MPQKLKARNKCVPPPHLSVRLDARSPVIGNKHAVLSVSAGFCGEEWLEPFPLPLLLILPGPGEAGLQERPGRGGRSGTERGRGMCGGEGFRAPLWGKFFDSDCAHGLASISIITLDCGHSQFVKSQFHAEEKPKLGGYAEKAKHNLVALKQRF